MEKKCQNCWKLEMNIEDMEVSYDIFLMNPAISYSLSSKGFQPEDEMDEEEDYEEEYELFRDEFDSPLYSLYFEIAKKEV